MSDGMNRARRNFVSTAVLAIAAAELAIHGPCERATRQGKTDQAGDATSHSRR